MKFNDYQKKALETAIYPKDSGWGYSYPALGLVGEAGEVAEKIKKIIRDQYGEMTFENKQELGKELGDVLWYIAILAHELEIDLDTVAQGNLDKLASRQKRGVIGGSGDNR